MDMKDVLVGEKPAMDALAVLAKGSSASDKELKEALVRFVLMISEAARFTSARADVISAWEKQQGDHLGSTSIDRPHGQMEAHFVRPHRMEEGEGQGEEGTQLGQNQGGHRDKKLWESQDGQCTGRSHYWCIDLFHFII
jgi:hypothetical protein